ncbi:BnaA02g35290D [Brassica napus]|uniref:BnaA02g35290D protein n=1 Tax=Brassica napus TaxID=3708 RepID=A0A078J2M3_BRANA|nr:BnaA02g35290D [Brassica napus]
MSLFLSRISKLSAYKVKNMLASSHRFLSRLRICC